VSDEPDESVVTVLPSAEERREHRRISAELKVNFESLESLVSAYTTDISRGGIFVPTEKFLPIGAVVEITLGLPNGGIPLKAIARVAYTTDDPPDGFALRLRGMGMEFLDVGGAPVANQIQRFVAETISSLPPPVDAPIQNGLALVVDDDELYRERASKAMRELGLDVVTANNGVEALGKALQRRPDVILSDVTMPEMDGWQLLRLIRSRPHLAQIPVIFLTRLTSDGERLRGYRLGVDDYVGKPFTAAELGARVRRIVERTRAQGGAPANKALRGDLSQVALPSLLSLAEMERRTGVLTLIGGDELATLYLREGAVVHIDLSVRFAGKQGIDKFFHVLDWKAGQFELAASDVNQDDQLNLKTSYVLLEHARLRDEGKI